jgi:exonuclease SbcC
MIPISLTIKGMYSYQNEQTIVFDKLTKAGLFGIFGPTGSGKSTILEAISYALYSETERLNRGDDRYYNMMNLKSDELLIDFIFKTGPKNEEYRFNVRIKRKKNFAETDSPKRTAYKSNNGVWEPIDANTITEIIGLSYPNFRRTIIIPQNKFMEFLDLTGAERSEMMKQLFGLEKYDLAKKTKILESRNNIILNTLNAQLESIGKIDEKLIKEKESELGGLRIQKIDNDKIIDSLRKKEKGLADLKTYSEELEESEVKHKSLSDKKKDIEDLSNKLHDYEFCESTFKSNINSLKERNTELSENNENLKKSETDYFKLKEVINELEDSIKTLKPEYDKREQYNSTAEELRKIIEIKNQNTKLKEIKTNTDRLDKNISASEQKIKSLKKELKDKQNVLSKISKEKPNIKILNNVKKWHNEKSSLEEKKAGINDETERNERDLANLIKIREKDIQGFNTKLGQNIKNDNNTDIIVKSITSYRNNEQKSLNNSDEEIHSLSAVAKLEEYADNLKDGQECPLCGSKDHPKTIIKTDIDRRITTLNKRILEFKSHIEHSNNLINFLKNNDSNIQDTNKRLKELKDSYNALNKNIGKHTEKFIWPEFRIDDEDEIDELLDKSESLGVQIEELNEEINDISNSLEEMNDKEKDLIARRSNLEAEKSASESSIKTLKKQIIILKADNHINIESKKLDALIIGNKNKFKKITDDYTRNESELTKITKQYDSLEGVIKTTKDIIKSSENKIKAIGKLIESALSKSNFNNLRQVDIILESDLNIKATRKIIDDHYKDVDSVKKNIERLKAKMEDKKYDLKEHNNLKDRIESTQTKLDKTNEDIGALQDNINKMRINLATYNVLIKEFEKHKNREENILIMRKLFTGMGFVNYISSYYLNNICQLSNERYRKLTNQKLSLELGEKNNFNVRDYLNGGKERSVKTLSGGQKFQASLCLALALADNIKALTRSSSNFFFLDEGFGFLDKDSLQLVFDTLKTLRKENRIVGVISHVEEMQNEIDVYLKIESTEDTGSRIYLNA